MKTSALLTICLLPILMTACASTPRHDGVAKALDLDSNTTRRYHYLADVPFADGLVHEGYIVALEKAPRALVGYVKCRSYEQRFHFLRTDGQTYCQTDVQRAQRGRHLEKTINNNDKAMFVSHIVAYEVDRGDNGALGNRIHTRFVYNIYPDRGAHTYTVADGVPVVSPLGNYYDKGWRALEHSLYPEIKDKLHKAYKQKRPYTHLIILAMGWDNDQPESIRRYNAILGQWVEQARTDTSTGMRFNPLVVGITWPSVWGWQSWFDLRQLGYKLVGYANKAYDADEIGYTYANWLVNYLGLGMRATFADQQPPLRVIAIGHSFGARIMSRAVFSRELLDGNPNPKQTVDLLVGLQGAFSANRFIPGAGGEGSPYVGLPGMHGLVLMTTSENDAANPLAYYLSRAEHIGGGRGLDEARKQKNEDYFHLVEPGDPILDSTACKTRDKVVVVDASPYVADHNDVLNAQIGSLLWSATRCVSHPLAQRIPPATPTIRPDRSTTCDENHDRRDFRSKSLEKLRSQTYSRELQR